MKQRLIRWLVARATPWPCGTERIARLRDALLWRLPLPPGVDAYVTDEGRVRFFRMRPDL